MVARGRQVVDNGVNRARARAQLIPKLRALLIDYGVATCINKTHPVKNIKLVSTRFKICICQEYVLTSLELKFTDLLKKTTAGLL